MTNESNEGRAPIIDLAVLDELQLIMEDEFVDVLQIFLDESVNLMSEIHAAFNEESDNLTRSVHTLKSCSRNVGAMYMGNIAEKMEELLIKEEVDSAKSNLDELQEVFTQSHALIKKHMEEHTHEVV